MYQTFKSKIIAIIFFTTLLFFSNGSVAYAQGCQIGDEPTPIQILCPIQKTINVLFYLSGSAFLVMVFITSWKYATAQGDPKALMGAKQSLTYTIIGFVSTVTTFAITALIGTTFGVDSLADPNSIFGTLRNGICAFMNFANIDVTGC